MRNLNKAVYAYKFSYPLLYIYIERTISSVEVVGSVEFIFKNSCMFDEYIYFLDTNVIVIL